MSSNVYTYFCRECGGQAKKQALQASEEKSGTLGSWRCAGKCPGKVKVRREKNR